MWLTIAKLALKVLVAAVGKIRPEDWARLGEALMQFLQNTEDRLPPGNPMATVFHAYRAAPSRLTPRGDK